MLKFQKEDIETPRVKLSMPKAYSILLLIKYKKMYV